MTFAEVDPLLPTGRQPPAGDRIPARTRDGRTVEGVLYRTRHRPGSVENLRTPGQTVELTPLLGPADPAGMRALLEAAGAVTVVWPSRDTAVIGTLREHGLLPVAVVAVRTESGSPAEPTVAVREAHQADLAELVALELEELRYAALVGGAIVTEDAAELLTPGIRELLAHGRIWVAESDGVTVGAVSTRQVTTEGPLGDRLLAGRWGFVATLSVAPEARGTGVGQSLMAVAHRELNDRTFLFYHPANPLSSVFWHRQGYRPLWTVWGPGRAG